MQHPKLVLLSLCILFVTGCYYDNKEDLYQFVQQQDCNLTTATFTADIKPLLETHCIRCHNNTRQDGNVNLEGYEQVQIYANNGSLYGTSNHETGYPVMPTSGVKIPACELEKIRIWIDLGSLNN